MIPCLHPSPVRSGDDDRPPWSEAGIAHALDADRFRLGDGRQARQAASCLLRPEPGDWVLLMQGQRELYVMAVLERGAGTAQLAVPGADHVQLAAQAIELVAGQRLGLGCLGSVDITSADGTVALQGRHLMSSASDTQVQTARHWVTQVEQALLQASALLHLQAEQGLVTARCDLKLDAERISLG